MAGIRSSVCISKSKRTLYESFSQEYAGFCINLLSAWSNFISLQNFHCITISIQSCLLFYISLQHSLIKESRVLSLSLHNLHLQFLSHTIKFIIISSSSHVIIIIIILTVVVVVVVSGCTAWWSKCPSLAVYRKWRKLKCPIKMAPRSI